jgi:predicted metal-binding membrane protein
VERVAPLAAIVLLFAASWAWLLVGGSTMADMDMMDMAMPSPEPWGLGHLGLVLAMWIIMMVAMMLPSVTPVVLLYGRVVAGREVAASPAILTYLFLAGYLLAWIAFSIVATAMQWALHTAVLISPAMQITVPAVAGMTLIVAGVYQWTPLKRACLSHCRSPLAFLLNAWRGGKAGAVAMGIRHGFYCTGCCWLLMAILFVVGVMNVAWVAAIMLVVLAEKLLPAGDRLAQASGAALVAWGAWLVLR